MMREDAGLHALLLGLVTVLFVLQPLAGLGWAPCWLPLAMPLATLAAGVLALAEVTRLAWTVAGCGIVLAAALGGSSAVVAGIASAAALLLLAVGLLRRVLAPGRVTGSGSRARPRSTCWWRCASLQPYEALEAAMPGAFVSPTGAPQTLRSFSLVAQTSTGFGNVMPAAPFARTLATLQAVTGQIFVAVLMARLVSLELAGRVGRGA